MEQDSISIGSSAASLRKSHQAWPQMVKWDSVCSCKTMQHQCEDQNAKELCPSPQFSQVHGQNQQTCSTRVIFLKTWHILIIFRHNLLVTTGTFRQIIESRWTDVQPTSNVASNVPSVAEPAMEASRGQNVSHLHPPQQSLRFKAWIRRPTGLLRLGSTWWSRLLNIRATKEIKYINIICSTLGGCKKV